MHKIVPCQEYTPQTCLTSRRFDG